MSWYQLGARPSATILEWDFTATWSRPTLSSIHITLQLLNKPQSREVSYTLVSVILAGSCSHGDKASCSLTMNMVEYVYCWSMLHSYGGPMCGDEGTPRGCIYDLSADLHWQTPHLIKPLMYIKKTCPFYIQYIWIAFVYVHITPQICVQCGATVSFL